METEFVRDYAMYAAIFGMFGFAWFGWAQENPPNKLRPLLGIGSAVSFIIACIGGYQAFRHWGDGSALAADESYALFGAIVAVEIISALVGALYLIKRKKQQYVATWVAFIVGIHFAPLAVLFHDPWLYVLAATIAASAAVSLRSRQLQPNTFVCITTGIILLSFGIHGIVLFMNAAV